MYRLLKPLLFRLDAERAHELVTRVFRATGSSSLGAAALRALYAYESPALRTTVAGLRFANPVGLAAGFDKRGELLGPMRLLGFGHVEVGTVTPRPQPGNPRPRVFRLPPDEALVNRMGFNSPGAHAVARALRDRRPTTDERRYGVARSSLRELSFVAGPSSLVIGVNIGKNRDTPLERAADDYLAAFDALAPGADYVTVNISSPNTPGLRLLHERSALAELLGALAEANGAHRRPLFLKLSPDEPPGRIELVVETAVQAGVAGFVAVNTTVSREGLRSPAARETGGLSGSPLAARARDTVALLYRLTGGRVPIIGVGGVGAAGDAYALMRAGASLVQLYTALVYQGPAVVASIKRGLAHLLIRDGCHSVADVVGADCRV